MQLSFCWKCQLLSQKILYFCCIILKVPSYKFKKLQVGRWFLQHKKKNLQSFALSFTKYWNKNDHEKRWLLFWLSVSGYYFFFEIELGGKLLMVSTLTLLGYFIICIVLNYSAHWFLDQQMPGMLPSQLPEISMHIKQAFFSFMFKSKGS